MMIKIKICGIRSEEEAIFCLQAGADAIGLVFAESPRKIDPLTARRICAMLPPFISRIGVFVNAGREIVENLAGYCGLTALQFHGQEGADYCRAFRLPVIKAVRVRGAGDLEDLDAFPAAAILLDGYHPQLAGGGGSAFDWTLAKKSFLKPVVLAGGLNADNIFEAVRIVRPYAVDLSSGVETGGRKDKDKISAFITSVRRFDQCEKRR